MLSVPRPAGSLCVRGPRVLLYPRPVYLSLSLGTDANRFVTYTFGSRVVCCRGGVLSGLPRQRCQSLRARWPGGLRRPRSGGSPWLRGRGTEGRGDLDGSKPSDTGVSSPTLQSKETRYPVLPRNLSPDLVKSKGLPRVLPVDELGSFVLSEDPPNAGPSGGCPSPVLAPGGRRSVEPPGNPSSCPEFGRGWLRRGWSPSGVRVLGEGQSLWDRRGGPVLRLSGGNLW